MTRVPHAFFALVATAALVAAAPAGLVPPDATWVTPDGRVRVIGYNDMDIMLPAMAARLTARYPGLRFDFLLKGTRTAPAALADGRSAFAPMGAEFEADDLAAWRRRFGGEPLAIPIAHDSLDPAALSSPTGILVAGGNPLRQLSVATIRRIVAPRAGDRPVRRWRDLGIAGALADRPVRVVGLAADTAIGALMLRRLGADAYVDGFDARRQSRDVAAAVAADPAAIGIANLNHVRPGLHALAIADGRGGAVRGDVRGLRSGRYPFDRQLLIYVRRDADGRVEPLARAFLDIALSAEGQAIVAAPPRRYIPLSPREVAMARARAGLPL